MDNIQTFDYVTLSKSEYTDLISKKLDYEKLLKAMYSHCRYPLSDDYLNFDSKMISHVLIALDSKRYFETLEEKREQHEKEIERLRSIYGNR